MEIARELGYPMPRRGFSEVERRCAMSLVRVEREGAARVAGGVPCGHAPARHEA